MILTMQNTIEKNKLNEEQENIRELMETSSKHLFITGKAGTGKSFLLQEFKASTQKEVVFVAPTGIAALNIGGQTIHSLFKIKPSDLIEPGQQRTTKATKDILEKIETLVIDEVSMVRADLMDAMDEILRFVKNSDEAFGGVQLIVFGDLFQLPPVVKGKDMENYFLENYGGSYFFNAKVWEYADLETHELNTNIRQKEDHEFMELLNALRKGALTAEQFTVLNNRARAQMPSADYVTLALTNAAVTNINEKKLRELAEDEFCYEAQVEGKLNPSEYPTEKKLKLKLGAQVMFLRNDKDKRYVNGSIGKVTYLSKKDIEVEVDGETISVKKEVWEKLRYYKNETSGKLETEVISAFKQFPLKLSWAITVHKSQGQTLDNVVLDMSYGAFAHGQTYVALSRCRSLASLYLKKPIRAKDLITDTKVLEFLA